jgi:hypothetical protein
MLPVPCSRTAKRNSGWFGCDKSTPLCPKASVSLSGRTFTSRLTIPPGPADPGRYAEPVTSSASFDLLYDPNEVGGDLVVECWISHGPRADDSTFDPQPGDWVTAGDDEEDPLRARVTRREGNRVWVQVQLSSVTNAVA